MRATCALRAAGFLTTGEAAEMLGVAPERVRELVRAGHVRSAGGLRWSRMLRVEDVEALRGAPGPAGPDGGAESRRDGVGGLRPRHRRMGQRRRGRRMSRALGRLAQPPSGRWRRPSDALHRIVDPMVQRVRTLLGIAAPPGVLGDRRDFEDWQADVAAILAARARPARGETSRRDSSPFSVRLRRTRPGGVPHRP